MAYVSESEVRWVNLTSRFIFSEIFLECVHKLQILHRLNYFPKIMEIDIKQYDKEANVAVSNTNEL